MNVGFYLTGDMDSIAYLCAALMVQSVRAAMPSARIVQFTDTISEPLKTVDLVQRHPVGPSVSMARTRHRRDCDGHWLFLDVDTLVLKDVSPLFALPFEIAIADRNWTAKGDRPMHGMRFNVGVIFSKGTRFWDRLDARLHLLEEDQRMDWYADQRMIDRLVRSGRYQVEVLSGSMYNYPPLTPDDRPRLAKILHFKGVERKQWMLEADLACA